MVCVSWLGPTTGQAAIEPAWRGRAFGCRIGRHSEGGRAEPQQYIGGQVQGGLASGNVGVADDGGRQGKLIDLHGVHAT